MTLLLSLEFFTFETITSYVFLLMFVFGLLRKCTGW